MKRSFITVIAIALISAFSSCKNSNNETENDTMGDTGLENTRSDIDKAEGDTMPLDVATGMDTTSAGGRADVGAAATSDSTNPDQTNRQ